MYDALFRHGFTRVDAERAHHLGFRAIRAARPILARRQMPGSPVEAMGLTFPNALGLAAGFDKNGVGIDALAALGFGHVEIGTVTALPQPGNPKPRLFRLPADRAVLNRMGFNNDGAEAVAGRLRGRKARLEGRQRPTRGAERPNSTILGVNIGKSKVTAEGEAVDDYERSARLLAPYADYLVVNVSSPNTPGLRDLQAVEKLEPILRRVRDVVGDLPLLVKIAPDLSGEDVQAVADLALRVGLAGIVATNTTTSRDGLATDAGTVERLGAGGLSGAPLAERSTAVLRLLRERVGPDLCLIGVGGISTPDDARARRDAGATLVQAYTGFVYGGPAWPRRVAEALM